MKKRVIPVGFFRELRGGRPHEPSLRDSVGDTSVAEEEHVLRYLRSGAMFVGSPGVVRDVLDSEGRVIGAPHILTDGDYAWPEVFAYYVERYRVHPPGEFLEHMRRNSWSVSSDVDVLGLELVRG